MGIRRFYTVEEDVCLALSLLQRDLTFEGTAMGKLHAMLRGIYANFVANAGEYGIDGTRRTMRSIEARIYVIRELFYNGQLHRHADQNNPLLGERFRLWSRVFGSRNSSIDDPDPGASASPHKWGADSEDSGSMNRKADILRRASRGRVQRKKGKHTKRLLRALTSIQRKRTEIKVQREENVIREQETDQVERKWKIELFHRILGISGEDDEMECAEFLTNLESIVEDDARLSLIREKKIQDRIENERENWEWERSSLEELMKRYFDK